MLLIDLALSSGSEEDFTIVESTDAGDLTPTPKIARFYDHYEVCLRPDGSPWELGRGAMGITYKALDRNLGSPVALKIINADHLNGPCGQERLRREARAAAGLRHPNIASIYHLGIRGDQCFYVMEYIEGETLDAYVQRSGALPCATALLILLQATRGLAQAHENRFIHRDIKPPNLMLVRSEPHFTPESIVKLIDFGLVKMAHDEGDEVVCRAYFAGTPHYASPEQLRCGMVDLRSDIYSLGLCLWYMLTGRAPSVSRLETDGGRLGAPLDLPWQEVAAKVPTNVESLLKWMLAYDPGLRPQTAAELLAQIYACQAGLLEERKSAPLRKERVSWRWFGIPAILLLVWIVLTVGWSKVLPQRMGPSKEVSQSQGVHQARVLYEQAESARKKLTKAENSHAIALYKSALAKFPEFADAHAGLAMTYFQAVARFGAPAGTLDLAISSAQHAAACNPESPRGYHAQAAISVYQGKPWESLDLLRKALEIDSKYLPAVRDFGMLWCYVGQPHLGYAWARVSTQLDPTGVSGWVAAGDASSDLCNDEQAVNCYQEALKINPASVEAYCGLMHTHLLQGNYEQTRRDYALARAVDKESTFPLNLKAQLELFCGDFQKAEEDYRQLLQQDRGGLVSFYGGISYLSVVGYLRCRAGDFLEGNTLLKEAARVHVKGSDGPQAIYDLAAIRAIQGGKQDALALLQQAIRSGWVDYRVTQLDPRFDRLRPETEFVRMISDLQQRVEQLRQESEKISSPPLSLTGTKVRSLP